MISISFILEKYCYNYSMNSKNILIGFGAIIATFLILFLVYKIVATPQINELPEMNRIKDSDHVKWAKDAKNVLVEYSDIQCPACKSFHDVIASFEASSSPDFSITKKTAFVFRHYPLYQIHKNAFAAAYAAEAAAVQNRFWEMTDYLYKNQSEWSNLSNPNEYFEKAALSLNLNLPQFKKDIGSNKVKERVQEDLSEAEKIGLNSTPTFFLNGRRVTVNTFEDFKDLLKSL
ncbi:hypothetical protein B6D29_04375 [Microgenomates bacterium UTCPR1]|nr:MAG: hypothetical protein B6D29_04375 [Microgenomates bacterium UTCPR1]